MNLLQEIYADLAFGDFTKGDDGGLVLRIDHGLMSLRELTRAISGNQNHLEAVRDLLEAVFNGNAGHLLSKNKTVERKNIGRPA